jgi:hypothetical protein
MMRAMEKIGMPARMLLEGMEATIERGGDPVAYIIAKSLVGYPEERMVATRALLEVQKEVLPEYFQRFHTQPAVGILNRMAMMMGLKAMLPILGETARGMMEGLPGRLEEPQTARQNTAGQVAGSQQAAYPPQQTAGNPMEAGGGPESEQPPTEGPAPQLE